MLKMKNSCTKKREELLTRIQRYSFVFIHSGFQLLFPYSLRVGRQTAARPVYNSGRAYKLGIQSDAWDNSAGLPIIPAKTLQKTKVNLITLQFQCKLMPRFYQSILRLKFWFQKVEQVKNRLRMKFPKKGILNTEQWSLRKTTIKSKFNKVRDTL